MPKPEKNATQKALLDSIWKTTGPALRSRLDNSVESYDTADIVIAAIEHGIAIHFADSKASVE